MYIHKSIIIYYKDNEIEIIENHIESLNEKRKKKKK